MPSAPVLLVATLLTAGLLGGCTTHETTEPPASRSATTGTAATSPDSPGSARSGGVSSGPAPSGPVSPGAASSDRRTTRPLAGVRIGIDPGHNGRNYTDPGYLSTQVWNGRTSEDCNTTGTETDDGYPEADFTWAVAGYLAADLRRAGAHVVLTRHSNTGVGPCVDRRAEIINDAHADVAIDIHADGASASARGFAILQPVASGINDAVIGRSHRYARILRDEFAKTGMPVSDYLGSDGLTTRDDLAGLNLTSVPQVLIECGNMRNAQDAALLRAPAFQRRAATRIATAMATFLGRRYPG
ncbi:MAG: N-acetylmuramoyl-L-alanine amidase [Nocardioides sp.]|uniref:N-acetylmuramoyl-L-alanine amidase n=1 Tax=Nocardioides sp. TaxID=35761 RepID=UPI0039E25205